jgi:hypothetical protein
MSVSTQFTDQILDHFLRGEVYLSLHTDDPGETGAHEVSGRSYRRAACGDAFGASAGGLKVNAREVEMFDLPAATVTHVALWDSPSRGKLLWSEPVAPSRKLLAGDALRFGEGKLGFSLI